MTLSEETHRRYTTERRCILCAENNNNKNEQKSFSNSSAISEHNKSVHKKLKITCSDCNQVFKTNADLNDHKKIMGH